MSKFLRTKRALEFIAKSCVLTALLWTTPAAPAAGGYTTPGSRALADSNSHGDYILAGDTKILIRRGSFESALKLTKEFPVEPSVVTGALLERRAVTGRNAGTEITQAIVCAERKVHFLTLDSEGKFTEKIVSLAESLVLKKPRDLRCAAHPRTGQWLAVNLATGAALLDGAMRFQLPQNSGRWTHTVTVADSFFVFGENGLAAQIVQSEFPDAEPFVRQVKAPFSDLQNRDTLFARDSQIIRTGEQQTALIEMRPGSAFPEWERGVRIPLNACAENGGCGAWLGSDQRWIVAGSYGTFVGRGQNFSRISAPLLGSDATTMGVALVAPTNQFILVGDIDSDVRALPAEAALTRFILAEKYAARAESYGRSAPRHLVWLKNNSVDFNSNARTDLKAKSLFSYRTHSAPSGSQGDVVLYEGRLPETWPKNWLAAEPEVEFEAITLANEWTPSARSLKLPTPQSTWWVSASGIELALNEISAKKVPLRETIVGVVDSGIDASHPLLEPVLHKNLLEIPGNNIDDDGNGLVDDVVGYDFVDEDELPTDEFGHGTHVAGLIANAWPQSGSLGGAPNAKLRIFRALDSSGKSNSIDLARAVAAAIRSRVDILNCSWGGGPETQALRDAFAAANAAEILIFSSAGNDGLNINSAPPMPKRFPGVLSVGASTTSGGRARFSNWGEKTVFAFAPGSDITSTLPGSQLGEKSGTSMASPIAASIGALLVGAIRERHPEWSREQQNAETVRLLCSSALQNKPTQGASKCGSLQAHRALRMLLSIAP